MNAREKFELGDRVRMTAARAARHTAGYSSHGVVTGFSRNHPHCVRVRRDGRRYVDTVNGDFWEIDPDPPAGASQTSATSGRVTTARADRAAEALVRMLWLYPNYRVDSRGPSGLILDALNEIAPDVAKEIREGAEPRAIVQRRWPEP